MAKVSQPSAQADLPPAHGPGATPWPAQQPNTDVFSRQFVSGDLATRATLAALMAQMQVLGVGHADRANAELILAEALNNVNEHAYASQPGPVHLIVHIRHNGLACLVCDQGAPMPCGQAPDPPLPPMEPPDMIAEGGFGWHIIRCLSTDLHYLRSDGWNRLSFFVPFGRAD